MFEYKIQVSQAPPDVERAFHARHGFLGRRGRTAGEFGFGYMAKDAINAISKEAE